VTLKRPFQLKWFYDSTILWFVWGSRKHRSSMGAEAVSRPAPPEVNGPIARGRLQLKMPQSASGTQAGVFCDALDVHSSLMGQVRDWSVSGCLLLSLVLGVQQVFDEHFLSGNIPLWVLTSSGKIQWCAVSCWNNKCWLSVNWITKPVSTKTSTKWFL